MDFLDVAEHPLIFDAHDMVSKVESKMVKNRREEAVILEGRKFKGLVYSTDLAKRKINTPHKTEIQKFLRRINPIHPETPIDVVLELIIRNDYKSIPVEAKEKILILTKIGMLKFFNNEPVLKKEDARAAMKFPYCITPDQTIATAMSVMRDLDVTRLPVVNEKGNVEGLVDTIDMLKADIDMQKRSVGDESGESIQKRSALVSSLMRKSIQIATPTTSLKEIVNKMITNNARTVIVKDKDRIAGIITPKLIINLIKSRIFDKASRRGVYLEISGIQEEDAFIKNVIDEDITNEIKKLGKIIQINRVLLHVDKHKKTGKRAKYSVHGRMVTRKGYFFAHDSDWEITKVIRNILRKLEREALKTKEK